MKNGIKSAKPTPTPLYIRTPFSEIRDPPLTIDQPNRTTALERTATDGPLGALWPNRRPILCRC